MAESEKSPPQLIRRRKPAVIKAVEDLDVFSKVPDTCVETTSYGGTASVAAILVIVWLVVLEVRFYLDTEYNFSFSPDTDMDSKLSINVDMDIAMPCGTIGADIVDSTNQNVVKFGELQEEYIHFALSESQRSYFNAKAGFNTYLREEYHALNKILWKDDFLTLHTQMPKLSVKESYERGPKQACRLHGKLELNKVAGNFHVTAGKTLPLLRGHAHIAAFMSDRDYNFSHRIHKFSFGEGTPSIVLPLEGDEKIAEKHHMVYHYFLHIVPTIVKNRFRTYQTYQYSVRELSREINHDSGSHGMSGIFFKYDMSGLKVVVTEESESFVEFLVRLCAIIGGVYATVGMLYNHLWILGCKMNIFSGRGSSQGYYDQNINANAGGVSNKVEKTMKNPILQTGSLNLGFQTPVVNLVQAKGESSNTLLENNQQFQYGHTPAEVVSLQTETEALPDILTSHTAT